MQTLSGAAWSWAHLNCKHTNTHIHVNTAMGAKDTCLLRYTCAGASAQTNAWFLFIYSRDVAGDLILTSVN